MPSCLVNREPLPFGKEPLLPEMMHSLMPGHAHGIGIVQCNDDPRVLFPELLVEPTTGYPGLFWNSGDLIGGKDLGLFWGNPCKLFANGRVEFDLVRLKLWA